MTLDSSYATATHRQPAPAPAPGAGTWAAVARTVHDALQQSSAVVITVAIGPRDILQIDIPRYHFEWSTPLEQFPAGATGLEIVSLPAADPTPTTQNLDSLLWVLGLHAFNGGAAPWLRDDQRVRLSRWPNLPKHMHSMTQMYMLAVLGNAYFSATELAYAVKAPHAEADAQNLINALSLMRLLRYSSEIPPVVLPEAAPQQQQQQSLGLFARLRARLGR